jgi:hypothetical protein
METHFKDERERERERERREREIICLAKYSSFLLLLYY